MKLKEWFSQDEKNKQAIYYSRNGRRYIYFRNKKISNFAKKLNIDQVVELDDGSGFGAWLY